MSDAEESFQDRIEDPLTNWTPELFSDMLDLSFQAASGKFKTTLTRGGKDGITLSPDHLQVRDEQVMLIDNPITQAEANKLEEAWDNQTFGSAFRTACKTLTDEPKMFVAAVADTLNRIWKKQGTEAKDEAKDSCLQFIEDVLNPPSGPENYS